MSEAAILVKIKPRSSYKKGMNANGVKILPNARKTFTCREDAWGEMVTGHTLEECKKYTFANVDKVFWKNYAVSLTDVEIILNLTNPQDQLKYKFLLSQSPQIVDHPEKITSETQYIMFNEEEVAAAKNTKRENLVKAMGFLGTMSEVQKAQFLRLYGFKTDTMTPNKIMDELCNQIEMKNNEGAEDFIAKFENKDKMDRILLKSLIQGEVVRLQGMTVYYGTDVIGATEDLAVEFLKDPKNAELKANFIQMLKAKQGK